MKLTKTVAKLLLAIITALCFTIAIGCMKFMFVTDTMEQFNNAGHGMLLFSFVGLVSLLGMLNIDEQC